MVVSPSSSGGVQGVSHEDRRSLLSLAVLLFVERNEALQILVLFNNQVMLVLVNELWAYGCSLGAALNGVWLFLSAGAFLVSTKLTGEPCRQAYWATMSGAILCTSYALCMVMVVGIIYKSKAPCGCTVGTLRQLRWKATIKQLMVGAVALLLNSSCYSV